MDEIVFIVGLVGLIIFGPWILLWVVHRRRKADHQEMEDRWRDLSRRVDLLSWTLEKLKSPAAPPEPKAATAAALNVEPPSQPVRPPQPRLPEIPPSQVVATAWVKGEPPAVPERAPVQVQDEAPVPPPQLGPVEVTPPLMERLRSGLELEEALGTNWLNKLGIVILVLGVAFFLAYQLKTLGPAGKVLVGYVCSAALLGAGLWFDRNERYRILARAGIGGGWALLFFTTYAMYHVQAAHVLSSQALDLVLMLVVAAAMVWHTLRYRSQVVTGLAFLLGYLTVTISHVNVYSLSAGAVLALGLVVIVGRMQWFELEIFGILASYFNHYLWLRPIIEPMHGHRKPFPEFAASAALLSLYWLVFRFSYVLRRPAEQKQERISTIAALVNTALLLLLFKYQSAHPEWAFWALLAIGGVETALAQLPVTRRRRTAVVVLSTIGVVLLIAAFPFRYSGTRLSVLWLLEAETLLLIGVWTREIVFRRIGILATAVVAGQMISYDGARILGMRWDGGYVHSNFRVALLFAVAALVFYLNSHWVARRWTELFAAEVDARAMQRLSYVAAILAAVGLWVAFPEAWTAVAWAALGLGLAFAGSRFCFREWGFQANGLAIVAFIRALDINFGATNAYHGITLRLISLVPTAALLYATARSSWMPYDKEHGPAFSSEIIPAAKWIAGTYAWAASFLLALLAWYELRPVGVAVTWGILGLVLFEIGLSRQAFSLRLQSYTAFAASFLRIFFVNLNAGGNPGEVSPRVYTVVPAALIFFYAYWRLQSGPKLTALESKYNAAAQCCYLGTLTFAALMRFELPADWVAAGWSALTLALFAIAWRSGRRIFLHQGLIIALAVLFRTVLHNFYQRSYFPAPAWDSRLLSVGSVVTLLCAAMMIGFSLRDKGASTETTGLLRAVARRPEQILFFLAIGILTILLALEMRHGMVTVSWGVEGVAVFLLALWLGERNFRLTGLGLLLLCVAKIVVVDVWGLNPRDRYLTFIVLGSALLLVSFLYTRHREALRQYL